MKRFIIISILLLSALCLFACGGSVMETSVPNPSSDSSQEASVVSVESDSLSTSERSYENEAGVTTDDAGGALYGIHRHYPDELCDIYLLSKIKTWDEIEAWVSNVYLEQADEEMDQLPAIYQAIKGLGIEREEFERANTDQIAYNAKYGTRQSVYTDKQIEIMFGETDENVIKKELKSDSTFYYGGRVYTVFELSEVDNALLRDMVEKGNLTQYLDVVERFAGQQTEGIESVQILRERVNN